MRLTSDSKRIFKNFLSLNLLQLSNILFPLIILPYVVRVIGVEKFGLVSFVQAFIMYFVILSDYGFNLAGTREISLHRGNPQKCSEIYSSILILKSSLGFLCLIIIVLLILSFDLFKQNWLLYIIGTGMLWGSIFFPNWFFQGIERMGIIPLTNISIRSLQVILIFLFVNIQKDYLSYLAIVSLSQFLIGIAGLLISIIYFRIKINFPPMHILKNTMKGGFNLFSANIGLNLFSSSNIFVLGILAGDYAAGIFSAADKIRQTTISLITSFIMSTYPKVSGVIKDSKIQFISFIRKSITVSILIGLFSSAFLFLLADSIIIILFGINFMESIGALRLFSVTPLIVSAGICFSILVLLPLGKDKAFVKIISFSILIHFILLIILVSEYSTIGAVYSVIITEALISVLSIITVYKNKLLVL